MRLLSASVLALLHVLSVHTSPTIYQPIEIVENIAKNIRTGRDLYRFGLASKQTRNVVDSVFPGGTTCKVFANMITRIDRQNLDKNVRFSRTTISDLLQELIPEEHSIYRQMVDQVKQILGLETRPNVDGNRVYRTLERFYNCLNKIAREGFDIRGFSVDDMLRMKQLSDRRPMLSWSTMLSHNSNLDNSADGDGPFQHIKPSPMYGKVFDMWKHIILDNLQSQADTTLALTLLEAFLDDRHFTYWEQVVIAILPSRTNATTTWQVPLFHIKDERRFRQLSRKSTKVFRIASEEDKHRSQEDPWCGSPWSFAYHSIVADNEIVLAALLAKEPAEEVCHCREDFLLSEQGRELPPNVAKWFERQGCIWG